MRTITGDLVKNTALGKMYFLGFLPATGYLGNGKQLKVGKPVLVPRDNGRVAGTVIVLGGDMLRLGCIEILDV